MTKFGWTLLLVLLLSSCATQQQGFYNAITPDQVGLSWSPEQTNLNMNWSN